MSSKPINSASSPRGIVGLPVSHTWRGAGTAIFLEFGELSQNSSRSKNPNGESTAMIEWTWRVEGRRSVAFGSWSIESRINRGLESLRGRTVEDVFLIGRLPELYIRLSGSRWVHSFMISDGELAWSLKLIDQSWLSFKKGKLVRQFPEQK